jgi:hypothetical protein
MDGFRVAAGRSEAYSLPDKALAVRYAQNLQKYLKTASPTRPRWQIGFVESSDSIRHVPPRSNG